MIDAEAVRELLGSVISPEGDHVEGFINTFGVDKAKLEADRDTVRIWISHLPSEFLLEGGGGWTALNLQQTREGELWTGHQLMGESLYVLAAALGLAKPLFPRKLWQDLPGGMPYVVFTLRDSINDPA